MGEHTLPQWVLLSIIASVLSLAGSALAEDQLQNAADQPAMGTIEGAVTDPSGSVVAGAVVTLETASSTGQRTTITDKAGALRFSSIATGVYKITITASGFSPWTATMTVNPANNPSRVSAVLQVAPASTQVNVTVPPPELATQQLKVEEKQRLAGVLPNFLSPMNRIQRRCRPSRNSNSAGS